MRRAFTLLSVATVAGCRLIDQTSFGGAPRPPAPQQMTAAFASGGTLPLLVVRIGDGVPYGDDLRRAIEGAEARHAAGRFRLEALVPAVADADRQAAALDASQAALRSMVDDMGADGITPDRVSLNARADRHVQHSAIELFQD